MRHLILASEVDRVANHFVKKIGRPLTSLKAVFIPTAGETEEDQEWIKPNRSGLNQAGIKTFDYTHTGKTIKDLERDLSDCDLIHVNGGNTFYLLLQAKKSGFDKFIIKQVAKGVIYTGSSAGSMITSPDIAISSYWETNIYEKELPNTKAFNLVDFIIFPHWGNPNFKYLYKNHRIMTAYKKGSKIILLNDDQYVEVVDGNYKIIDVTKD
jgi:dipeptidase E